MSFRYKGKPLSYWLEKTDAEDQLHEPAAIGVTGQSRLQLSPANPESNIRAIEQGSARFPASTDSRMLLASETTPDSDPLACLLETGSNPALTKIARQVRRTAKEAERCARAKLFSIVGAITGTDSFLASTCGLYLVTERKTLRAEVLWNIDKPDHWELSIESPGIVPRVARTGRSVTTDNCDPDYLSANPRTQSELAVAIQHEGEVIGVLNLESIRPHSYSDETLTLMEKRIPDLVPHLLVLRSLDRGPELGCPWHPEKHGWDLQDLIGQLCHAFVDGIGKATTICTVWYVDQDKQDRFAYGTSGYDWPYHQCQRALACSDTTPLEKFITEAKEEVLPIKPAEAANFLDQDKADVLEIVAGLLKNVIRESGSRKQTIVTITAYFTGSQGFANAAIRQKLAEAALPGFAILLGRLIRSHGQQRRLLATAVFRAKQARLAGCSTAARLEVAIQQVCEILQSPAASLYAYDERNDVLECITTTGFRKEGNPVAANAPNERDSSVQGDRIALRNRRGHTIAAFRSAKPVRRNRLSFPDEKGLTEHCPERGATSRPEFIAGESIADGEHSKRRFLGCRVLYRGTPIGVLRVVRPEESCPFTKCDESLIESQADQLSSLLFQRIHEVWEQNDRRPAGIVPTG